MWSDGERYPNGLTDGVDGVLVSYDKIYRSQPILAGVIDMIAYRAATLPLAPFTPNAGRFPDGGSSQRFAGDPASEAPASA